MSKKKYTENRLCGGLDDLTANEITTIKTKLKGK